jgi:hypothetical protein
VVNRERRPAETDLLVESVADAVGRIVEAGERLLHGPLEIRIGSCAVVADPWNNEMVILDMSKGKLEVDSSGNVLQVGVSFSPKLSPQGTQLARRRGVAAQSDGAACQEASLRE